MSLSRLAILVALVLTYSTSQAQKESVVSRIDTTVSGLSEADQIRKYYKSGRDSLINSYDTSYSADEGKSEMSFSKKLAAVGTITNAPIKKSDQAQTTVLKYNKKVDSTLIALQELPNKYFKKVEKKIDTYSNRITSKTEKTLTKLSKWENKIKRILDQASPETSAKLFGKNQITFTSLLQKLKEGQNIASSTRTKYDEYKDKLSTSLQYVQTQKNKLDSALIKPATKAANKMKELEQDVANTGYFTQTAPSRSHYSAPSF